MKKFIFATLLSVFAAGSAKAEINCNVYKFLYPANHYGKLDSFILPTEGQIQKDGYIKVKSDGFVLFVSKQSPNSQSLHVQVEVPGRSERINFRARAPIDMQIMIEQDIVDSIQLNCSDSQ